MSLFKKVWKKIRKLIIILFIAQFLYIIILKWVYPPVTVIQLSSWIDGYGLKRSYVKWNDISPEIKLAVIAAEDQLFPGHSGFDWKSIEKVVKEHNSKTKRIRGASTISQQVAKNVFLWNGRSWIRKGLEVYFTFMIEMIWGKKRILEIYLNVAETGKGVFGVESAAYLYFKKPAKRLTQNEAARIAACLPNPRKYTIRPMSATVQRRSLWITQQMSNLRLDPDIRALLQ